MVGPLCDRNSCDHCLPPRLPCSSTGKEARTVRPAVSVQLQGLGFRPAGGADGGRRAFSPVLRLAPHRKIKHGARDPVYLLVGSVHCPVCMVYFHNRVRVLNHLKYRSTVCRLNLKMSGPVINVEQADELDEGCRELRRSRYAAGLRAHAACAEPCFRLCGPLPLPLIIDGNKHTNKCNVLGFGPNYH